MTEQFQTKFVKIIAEQLQELATRTNILSIQEILQNQTFQFLVISAGCLFLCTVLFALFYRQQRVDHTEPRPEHGRETLTELCVQPLYKWSVFDLAKTAYETGHTAAVIDVVEKFHYDVNSSLPSNGLNLFLCSCLSGKRELIQYMIGKGADVTCTTKGGDTALYLATFGILSFADADIDVLSDLVAAGCDVNASNLAGFTPLHRAASVGNMAVIRTLLKYGADKYQATAAGVFPIDSAINAGHLEAAKLLEIQLPNPHVWDVVEPHTPPHITLGLQSPQRKHLVESTRVFMSPRIL